MKSSTMVSASACWNSTFAEPTAVMPPKRVAVSHCSAFSVLSGPTSENFSAAMPFPSGAAIHSSAGRAWAKYRVTRSFTPLISPRSRLLPSGQSTGPGVKTNCDTGRSGWPAEGPPLDGKAVQVADGNVVARLPLFERDRGIDPIVKGHNRTGQQDQQPGVRDHEAELPRFPGKADERGREDVHAQHASRATNQVWV